MKRLLAALAVRARSPSSILLQVVVFTNVIRIVNSVILTRVLGPKELGLTAIIQSIFFAMALISDAGIQPFVVRHANGDDPHFLDVIWSVHVSRGIGLWLIGAFVGAIIYWAGSVPSLGLLLGCAALTFAIDGAASPSFFTTLRSGNVRLLSLVDVIGVVSQFTTSLYAAFILHNAWAIVIGMIINSLVRSTLSFLLFANARRRFAFDAVIMRDLWKFSRLIATSSILTLVLAQIDKLLLASFINVSAFGVYTTGANLGAAPQALAQNYTARIIFPNLSGAWRREPTRMKAHYYGSQGIIFFGYLIAAGVLIGTASTVVDLLYDDRYVMAGVYLRYLALPTAMLMLTRSLSECLVAIGRTSITLEMNIGRIIWLGAVGPVAFFVGGVFAFLGVLASVELVPYLWGAYSMRRALLLSPRREALGFAAILVGFVGGLGFERAYFDIAKPLLIAQHFTLHRSVAR